MSSKYKYALWALAIAIRLSSFADLGPHEINVVKMKRYANTFFNDADFKAKKVYDTSAP